MKRIYNHIILKLSSYKILVIVSLLLIYHFIMYMYILTQNDYCNIYDLFMKQFNYFSLFVVYSLGYLLIIYNINQKTEFYKYYYMKFKNKVEVYNVNIITLLIISILFTFFINIVCFAEGIFTLPLDNSYSEYFYHIMNGSINVFYSTDNVKELVNLVNPIGFVLLLNLFSIFYFFLEGLLYFVIDSFIAKDALSLIIVVGINTFNRFVDSLGGIASKLSFTNNIFFVTSPIETISNYSFIFFRLLYWLILIGIIYFIGKFRASRMDYRYRK